MANYRYKVCKGQKVVAVSTTLREAEAEAKRIGGIVLRVGVQNPPSKGYDTFLGGGAFSKAYARKPPVKKFRDQMGNEYDLDAGNQAVEAITKRGGMIDYSQYDAMKTAIVLARKKLAKAPEALKYLPEIVPVRLDNEPPDSLAYLRGEQGAREYVYAMPVYDQLRARMQTGEPLPRLATALYQLVNRTVTGFGSLLNAARLFADEIANEERQGRLVSPVLEQVKAEEPHIVKVLNTLHNVIVGMGCGRIGDSYYGSDLHAGNFALKGDQLILLDPAACDLPQDALDELWYQNGWAKRPAVQNPAPAADQTKSAAFKAWFGNSKVVKRGKPLVVYHGTRDGGFTEFKLGKIDPHHNGFFFTSHKPTALSYSGSYDTPLPSKENLTFGTVAEFRRWLNDPANKDLASRFWFWEQAFDYEDEDGNPTGKQLYVWTVDFDNLPLYGPRGKEFHRSQDLLRAVEQALANRRQIGLYGAYLSLQNPLVVDCKGKNWNQIPRAQLEKAGVQAGEEKSYLRTYDITHIAKKLGYDGVIFKQVVDYGFGQGTEPSDVYVAFEPTQIKSATANRGTFSKTDADIRNPTPAADQTQSAAFKAWFGNSKVVDKNGKPLVVYHGTRAQFTAFDKRYVRDQLGFHFGTKGQAKRAPSGKGKGSRVDAYWLSIQNPLRVRDEGSWTTEAAVDAINRATGLRIRYGARDAEIVRALQAAGYDGIVYSNRFEYGGDRDFGVDSWIAFEPTQIKSATDNRGTFDPHDPDIRNPSERTWIPPAEDEAKRVGGRVVPVGRKKNPSDQTQSAAFKAWFGNSKVVDKNGKPRVLYHGTHADFTVFDTSGKRRGQSFGAMFTPSKAYATNYGRKEYGGKVLAVYLRIEKPFDDKNKKHRQEWEDKRLPLEGWVQYAKRAGYDGAITMLNEYVVFDPNQIKSATDNRGTFDPHDPDIRNPSEPTWIPPADVAEAARRGLELRGSQPPSNRCCTPVGIARAKQLANRQPVSETTLRRMKAYFDRHVVDRKGKGWGVDSKGYQAWLAWGGDSGRDWCKNILRGL